VNSAPGYERAGTVVAVACFSVALSVSSVAVPILIVRAGYATAAVGFFVALSAVAQIGVRFRVGAMMRRVADKHLVGAAAVLMALGSGLLIFSAAMWIVIASQLLQGAARGLFWTGIQTHAVRTSTVAARGLASVNLASGAGLILGPGLAGVLLETSAHLAMGAAMTGAAVGLLPVLLMARLPVFPSPDQGSGEARVSRRTGVRIGSWAAASAGAWRGLMGTYVPVALNQAAHSSTVIGAVLGAANTAEILAGWASRWVRSGSLRCWLPAAIAVTGLGLAVFGVTADTIVMASVALIASGLGMGMLQTLGPATAAEAVGKHERGDAMATVGLYRAGAAFVAPFGVAALVLAMPVGWALAAGGAVLALPAGYALRKLRG
jgi:MFS family permease